jgi:ATP-dependent RNA helicase DDX5/DBP2
MAESDDATFRRAHGIEVTGGGVAVGLAASFDDVVGVFDARLVAALRASFTAPTPVQAVGWPLIAGGADVIAVAETGSGKTLAYALPAMAHAARRRGPPTQCCDALVLAPTRELAAQIEQHVAAFGSAVELRSVCCYGGTDVALDVERLADGVELLVATPGRLLLLLQRHAWLLTCATFVVLDEADRMLDMGFEPQISAAFAQLPTARQTLFFTATWPPHVRELAARFVTDPVLVRVGQDTDAAALRAVATVSQAVEVMAQARKRARLDAVLTERGFRAGAAARGRALVFVNTKARCAELAAELAAAGVAADAMHGDRPQAEREAALAAFAHGGVRVLVATDVAARGIDVADVRLVLNYDFPMAIGEQGIEDYVHRIGRTGRAGHDGEALTFFSAETDAKLARRLIQVLEGAGQVVPAELRALDAGDGGEQLSARQKRKLPYQGKAGGGGRGSFGGGGAGRGIHGRGGAHALR